MNTVTNQSDAPTALIVGPPRCGTTSLYHYLAQHPRAFCPSLKEPKYFSSLVQELPHEGPGDRYVDQERITRWEDYRRLWEGAPPDAISVDGSSEYFVSGGACAARIREDLGDVAIIVMLRDPVNRAVSAYNNMKRDQREPLPIREAFASEGERRRANWDTMWWYHDASRYADRLKAFQNTFSRVLVLCFERFVSETAATMSAVEAFLGLEPFGGYELSRIYAKSGRSRGALSSWILDRRNPVAYRLRELAKKYVPRRAAEAVAGRLVADAPQDDDLLAFQRELWLTLSKDMSLGGCEVPFDPEEYWGPPSWSASLPDQGAASPPTIDSDLVESPSEALAQRGETE